MQANKGPSGAISRKRTGGSLRVLVSCLTLLTVASMAHEDGDDPEISECAVADALRDSGFLAEATEAYTQVLQKEEIADPQKKCAIDALPELRRRLADANVAKAMAHEARGDESGAITALEEALAIDPRLESAIERLRALTESNKADEEMIARAEQLVDLGLTVEARELITEYVTSVESEYSGEILLPPKLDALYGGSIKYWRNLRRTAPTVLKPIAEMAAIVITFIILFVLIGGWRGGKPKIQVTGFDRGGFEEEHIGRIFSLNVHSKLDELRSGGQAGALNLVTGPIEAIELPSEVQAVIPPASFDWLSPLAWARAIPALVNWITRQRVVRVTGSLHAPGKRGVGVTVSLVESNQILSAYTFWQQAFDAPSEPNKQDDDENLYRIAEYVAVWLLFETRARFGDRELELLGAHDWYSYALFKAGLFAENDERQLAARNLYVMALRRSPSFRGARTNLGLWYIRHKEPQRAIRHLQQAIDEANDELNSDRDASLYVAKYNLAAIEDEAGLTDKAIADTQDLSAMIDAALRKIEAGEEGYTDPALKQNLQDIKPAAKAMLAGIRVREGDDSALKILDTLSSTARLGVKEQYNLACSFSLAAAYVRNNPSPEHPKSAATYLDQSLEHLKRAFQLFPRATAQAQTDPTLEEVQQQRAHELSALIARFDSSGNVDDIEIVEERKLPLAELAIVGDEHARLLAEQGIESPEQLLAKTVSRSGRKSLAKELGLSYRIVTLWAQAADLTRIVGLRIPQVNLLASYRINTIAELASCSARQLAEDLAIMSISMSTGDSPDEIELTRWIEEAQTTTRPTVIE